MPLILCRWENIETDQGTLDITTRGPSIQPISRTLADKVSLADVWLYCDDRNLIWLPPDYRSQVWDVCDSTIVMGQYSGRIFFLNLGIELRIFEVTGYPKSGCLKPLLSIWIFGTWTWFLVLVCRTFLGTLKGFHSLEYLSSGLIEIRGLVFSSKLIDRDPFSHTQTQYLSIDSQVYVFLGNEDKRSKYIYSTFQNQLYRVHRFAVIQFTTQKWIKMLRLRIFIWRNIKIDKMKRNPRMHENVPLNLSPPPTTNRQWKLQQAPRGRSEAVATAKQRKRAARTN